VPEVNNHHHYSMYTPYDDLKITYGPEIYSYDIEVIDAESVTVQGSSLPDQSEGPKDLWFDQWLCAKGDPLKSLVRRFLMSFENPRACKRKRARKAKDQANFEQTVEAVIVNLAYIVLYSEHGQRLVLPRNTGAKRTRYDNPGVPPKALKVVVDRLEGWAIDLNIGVRSQGASTIAPTDWFRCRFVEAGISGADFGHREDREVIILSRTTKSHGWNEDGEYKPKKTRKWISYQDTADTIAYRFQVRMLNAFLGEVDIAFIDDGQEPRVDSYDHSLRRYFTHTHDGLELPTFDQNGRLFGGFWMNLKKERRANIRINGEPIADLDFKNMFARLAYASVGQEPPEGDLYDVSGFLEGYDNTNKDHRDGIKQAFNSLLNGGRAGSPELFDLLPDGATALKVRNAIQARHPALAPILETSVGMSLMFMESQVLLAILECLMAQDIVALPIHDGLMVAESQQAVAARIMEEMALALLGITMPVVAKSA
jgi:hypothetical protein